MAGRSVTALCVWCGTSFAYARMAVPRKFCSRSCFNASCNLASAASDVSRLDEKITEVPEAGCWLWTGAVDRRGYGAFWFRKRVQRAHRASYIIHRGEVPDGLDLDHLCRTPACVNPWHLEPVTHRENCRRGDAGRNLADRNRAKTHCPRGHEYSGANLYVTTEGARACRTCRREWERRNAE